MVNNLILKSQGGQSHILCISSFTSYAENQARTFVRDIGHAVIFIPYCVFSNFATFIYFGEVSAKISVAKIETPPLGRSATLFEW